MGAKKKLVTALSGGVDSSVAAAIYLEKGYEIIGVTLKLDQPSSVNINTHYETEDELLIKAVVDTLNIEHHFLNLHRQFRECVLRYAWDEYRNARTPNPCAKCNPIIKFGLLLDHALQLGAEGIITGHHAKILKNDSDEWYLKRGQDPVKDQTYFLFALNQKQLAKTHFPIGDMTKDEVRSYARKIGLPNAEQKESQDVCFVQKGERFTEILSQQFSDTDEKKITGYFIDVNGKRLGKHQGIHHYTIGQRKGLKIAMGKPAYIQSIDSETGDIVLTTEEDDLYRETLQVRDINWQLSGYTEKPFDCEVQIRYRSKPVTASIIPGRKGENTTVKFDCPQRAVTPGQAAVFYHDEKLIGGGWIV